MRRTASVGRVTKAAFQCFPPWLMATGGSDHWVAASNSLYYPQLTVCPGSGAVPDSPAARLATDRRGPGGHLA